MKLLRTEKQVDIKKIFFDKGNDVFDDYNLEYEFGGKVIEYNEDKSLIEIRNKLKVGDTLEILIPGKIENYEFQQLHN